MPVEAATYLNTLDATQPPAADGIAQGDDHLRLIKSALKATFPSLTGPVTGTQADLNAASLGFHNAGTVAIAHATGSGDALLINSGTTTAPAGATVRLYDATNANPHDALTASYAGTVTALAALNAPSILQAGAALIPAGVIVMWSGSVGSIPAGWVLCDGTNGTPDLRDRFVLGAQGAVGAGATGGAAAFSGSTSTAGSHAHGGSTGPAGGHTPAGTTDSQGDHNHSGTTGSYALAVADLPAHTHPMVVAVVGPPGTYGYPSSSTGTAIFGPTGFDSGSTGGGQAHAHGIGVQGAHTHTLIGTAVADHAHSIATDTGHSHTITGTTTPPYMALCFIMKT